MRAGSEEGEAAGPVLRSAAHEGAYSLLRARLIDGLLTPGQTILAGEMAASMSLSLTPVREAIQRLIGEGALEPLPNGNVRVRIFSEKQLDEWWVIRTLLESLAIARAAERADTSRLRKIAEVNRAANAALDAEDVIEFGRLNREFHFQCYALAGSPILSDLIAGLWEKAGPYIVMAIPTYIRAHVSGQDRPLMAPHEEILSALGLGDRAQAMIALRRDIGMTAKWKTDAVARLMQEAVATLAAFAGQGNLISTGLLGTGEVDGRPDVFQRPASRSAGAAAPRQRRRTAQTKACLAIRRALIAGRFLPGEHITVRMLCDETGLGAMPVREALREVTSEGVLEKLENGRLRVRILTETDRRDLHDLRLLLEAVAAAAAVQSARPGINARLARIRERMGAAVIAGDASGVRSQRHAFMEALCEGSGLDVLSEVLGRVWLLSGPSDALQVREDQPYRLLDWHDAVLGALSLGDVPAVLRAFADRADSLSSAPVAPRSDGRALPEGNQ